METGIARFKRGTKARIGHYGAKDLGEAFAGLAKVLL